MEIDTLIQHRRERRASRSSVAAVGAVLGLCVLMVGAIVLFPFDGPLPNVAGTRAAVVVPVIPPLPKTIPPTLAIGYDKYDNLTCFSATVASDKGTLMVEVYEDGNVVKYTQTDDTVLIYMPEAASHELVFLADGVRIKAATSIVGSSKVLTMRDLLTLANANTVTYRLDYTEHVVTKEGRGALRALAAHMLP